MDYYNEIKNELIDNEINKKVKDYSKNKYELEKYYNVGKLLAEAGKHYGEGITKDYSSRLTKELGKGYTFTSLTRMKKLYFLMSETKVATLSQYLTWSHYVELLPIENINKIHYYIKLVEEQKLSVRQLRDRLKSKEYERLPEETKNKLLNKEEHKVVDFVKNSIMIKKPIRYDDISISEKLLQKIILEDIDKFLMELGSGFCYIGKEYKVNFGGNTCGYIDFLLYNIKYKCYIVVELKVTEIKKEHFGQIKAYMNYVDRNIKTIEENNTIGIILTRKNNKYIIEYCSEPRILSKEYVLI